MAGLVNVTELAKLLGKSKAAITKAYQAGRLTVASRDKNGRPQFDPAVAIREDADRAELNNMQRRQEAGKKTGGRPAKVATPPESAKAAPAAGNQTVGQRLTAAKAEKAEHDARLAEIEVMEKESTLVPIEKVRQDGATLGAVLMGILSVMPDRLAPQLADMTDTFVVRETLDSEIQRMIAEIQKACNFVDKMDTLPGDGSDDAAVNERENA